MQIITTAAIKGGTGKTTTAAALAQAAAADGKKVLCIDLDPQGNLSFFTGADQTQAGSYELITGSEPAPTMQRTEQGLTVIAASANLATLTTAPGSAKRLQAAIEPIRNNFDYIFIDTPPQMGELTYNALQASTGLLCPLEADYSSLTGLYQIIGIAGYMARSNPDLEILGAILTRYDPRPKLNKYLQGVISEKGAEAGAPLLITIRAGIAIREAQTLQQSLFEYAPDSNPAKDYKELYQIIKKGGRKHGKD